MTIRFAKHTAAATAVLALALWIPVDADAQGKTPRQRELDAARRRRGRTVPARKRPGMPPTPATPAAGAKTNGDKKTLPGEAAFNECLRIPARRRIKVTLKPESSLKDLVGWISSMTCKKFIIGSNLHTQKVTLVSPTAVTAGEAYRAFLSALDVMGLTVVPTGRFLKVVQGNWAIQSSIPTIGPNRRGTPGTDQAITRMVRIQHVDVNQLLLVLNKMKSRSGDVTAYKPTNMLIITDNGNNVRRLLRIIRELDVPVTGEKIWVVRLRHADVEEVKKILDQIFAQQRGQTKIPRVVTRGRTARRGAAARREKVADDGVPSASKIIADPSINSLIFVASASAFARIMSLLKKLDVESSGSVSQRIHVYYLANGDAEEMASTLASLTGGAAGRGRRGRTTRTTRGRRGRTTRNTRGRTGGTSASLFEGDVKVSADKATNALVIIASTRDYINLRAVIRKLDIPRRQVFVEASILEITLNKERRLGFAYHGGGIAGSGDSQAIIFGGVQHSGWGSLVVDPLSLMGLAVGARGSLIDGSAELLGLQADIPGFGVMFQALQTNSNVNVLSSPHILTTDNEQAEITVGQNIPFQGAFVGGGVASAAAGQAGLAGILPTVSVQRQDVALKLKITPHVNDSNMVRLELEQEVSDIVSANFNNLGPATSKRTAKTTVVVRDQQTVVIGGLISDRAQESVSKVPLLGDIPILGYLFKHTTVTKQKTNLLIVLTPYIIRDQADLRRIFQKKLRERRDFIERYTSFKQRDPGAEIDYRHKRGLLGEIFRVSTQVEAEALLLLKAKQSTNDAVGAPVDMPKGMAPKPTTPRVIQLNRAVTPGAVTPGRSTTDQVRTRRPPR
ncbi:MAG: type II secretion system secretin GspD [Myxococcales bacterium]|nr:type II secretion system secretin GspD [Myxococcales bacterium]